MKRVWFYKNTSIKYLTNDSYGARYYIKVAYCVRVHFFDDDDDAVIVVVIAWDLKLHI